MSAPLILVDGSSYFYRAFHALPPLTNRHGQPTGAIYGVVNMIKRLLNDYQPTHLAVVFDVPGKTFRDALYPLYKAHRPATPPDLKSQFEPLCAVLTAMGIPLISVSGVEADDVIGSYAHQATLLEMPLLISTSDKDMAQLVNPFVSLINTMSNQRLDIAGVQEKFGVLPRQIIDYLTLIGDTADNVPGVPKCGPKTAVKWLAEYDTLTGLLEHAEAITGKIGESLRNTQHQLPLSKQLVTIKTDVELPLTLAELMLQPANHAALLELTQQLEFKSWFNALQQQTVPVSPAPTTPSLTTETNACHRIDTLASLQDWVTQFNPENSLCVHVETQSPLSVSGIFCATGNTDSIYVPLEHPMTEYLNILKPMLENAYIKKIGHNLKRDYTLLQHHGIQLAGLYADTMLEAYLYTSHQKNHDLLSLVQTYLGETPAGVTAALILRLHHALVVLLSEPLQSVLQRIEMPLVSILADMELHGVLINTEQLAALKTRFTHTIHALEKAIYEAAGHTFNLNSPKQLLQVLYEQLQLPQLAKTPTGQPSTGEAVLQQLARDYPIAAHILEYRGLSKLLSTYIDALPKHINPRTHRIHTSYNQAITATGRLSSSEPNLQNIPIKNPEGRLIRQAFVAPEGALLLTADYSQIELRIMAHLSGDPQLIHAFAHGLDVHTATASELFSVTLNDVTPEQRRRAKAVNFGLIYGMSAFGLANQLNISREDAQHYINVYFERYPNVLHYMETTRLSARTHGYVETVFGRRLSIPDINSPNKMRQKAAERMAINAPMQGTAADIIKLAMIAISHWQTTAEGAGTRMIMQVHDELVFEIQEEQLVTARASIQALMEHTVELSIPLLVSVGIGANWDVAH